MKLTFKQKLIRTATYSSLALAVMQPVSSVTTVFAQPNDILQTISNLEDEELSIHELLAEQEVTLEEIMQMIAQKEEDAMVLIAEIEEKESELVELNENIADKQEAIDALKEEMKEAQDELDETIGRYDKNIDIAKGRFKTLQVKEQSTVLIYIEAILNSENFLDILGRINAVSKILSAHSELITQIQEQADAIVDMRTGLQSQQHSFSLQKTDLEVLEEQVRAEQDVLIADKKEAEKLITQFESERSSVESAYEDNLDTLQTAQETLDGQHLLLAMAEAEEQRLEDEHNRSLTEEEDQTVSLSSSLSSATNALTRVRQGRRDADKVSQVIERARGYFGVPYVWGGSTPTGFDCSGLVQDVYGSIGVDFPRTAAQQATVGTPVAVSDAQPGDLLFWDRDGHIYHVAIYIGGGEYIHAPRPGRTVGVASVLHFTPSSARRVIANSTSSEGNASSTASVSKQPAIPVQQSATSDQSSGQLLGSFEATAYAIGDGLTPSTVTANGTNVANTIHSPEGYRMIAVDTSVIPMNTIVRVVLPNGETFLAKASDTGSAINGRKIDLLVESPRIGRQFGRQYGIKVYSVNQ